jgi:hypothetical protein
MVRVSRGILDVLTIAVAKEQRTTASNNSQLSLYCAGDMSGKFSFEGDARFARVNLST